MLNFKVEKMTCGHCARAVTEAVHGVEAGARVDVDLKAGRVSVAAEGGAAERIAAAIRAAGYEAAPLGAAA